MAVPIGNPWPHRCAVLLASFVFLIVAVGASLTSLIRPLPGAPPAAESNVPPAVATPEIAVPLERAHEILAGVLAVLAFALAGLLAAAKNKGAAPAWLTAGLVAADAALGIHPASGMLPPLAGVLHALLAPALFSAAVVTAVLTAKSGPPIPAENLWPPVHGLAIWVPAVLMLQIALGAGFRHDTMGVVWHILNAMVVLLLVLLLGFSVLRQCPGHPALRPAAISLLSIAGVQALLGFGVYITLLLVSENNAALMAAGAIHVLIGSLTLAASVVLAVQLRRGAAGRKP